MKILFLCTGNTCRSPLCEVMMNKIIKEKNLPFECESAGLAAYSGDEASEGSKLEAKKRGLDLSAHRSRSLSSYMIDKTDLFVVMNISHKMALEKYVPEEKIRILRGGIFDPYGGNEDVYEKCANEIEKGLNELVAELLKISVYQMNEADIDAVEEIEKECFSSPWTRKGIESELENENARFFTAEYMGERAGYLGMHIVLDECYIANIAVREKFRRKGIGNELLKVAEETAKSENCCFISLEVRVGNEKAIALYKKRGYNEVGQRKNFYTDPIENALIMTKNFSKD